MNTFLIIAAAAVILILIYLFLLYPGSKKRRRIEESPIFCDYAHRGLWTKNEKDGIPENSLTAYKRAVDRGFGIELDVRLTRDGIPVILHDDSLLRLTGIDKKAKDLTYHELSALTLCGTEERIPSLSDVLALVNGKVPLLVELKGEDLNISVCERADALLKEYKGSYCIESFNPLFVRWYKKHRPEVFRGLLTSALLKKKVSLLYIVLDGLLLNFCSRPDFIAFNDEKAHSLPVCIATRLFGAKRFFWTPKGNEEIEKARTDAPCVIFEE